ncbi:hypothetical protein F5141DRAFT_1110924 [Pisolithus sp. B1]|nr:hypothetical protein F5141DRAFT_1110924 [Pisolithus sp. B1]
MTSTTNSLPSIGGSSGKGVDVTQLEDDVAVTKDKNQLYNPYVDLSGVNERTLIRMIDMRTIPWLSFYISFVSCIGRVSGMPSSAAWRQISTSLIPSTSCVCRHSSYHMLSSSALEHRSEAFASFHVVINTHGRMEHHTVQSLVHNFSGLIATRWLPGWFEAGLYPGVNSYLSCVRSSVFAPRYFSLRPRSLGYLVVCLRQQCQT